MGSMTRMDVDSKRPTWGTHISKVLRLSQSVILGVFQAGRQFLQDFWDLEPASRHLSQDGGILPVFTPFGPVLANFTGNIQEKKVNAVLDSSTIKKG